MKSILTFIVGVMVTQTAFGIEPYDSGWIDWPQIIKCLNMTSEKADYAGVKEGYHTIDANGLPWVESSAVVETHQHLSYQNDPNKFEIAEQLYRPSEKLSIGVGTGGSPVFTYERYVGPRLFHLAHSIVRGAPGGSGVFLTLTSEGIFENHLPTDPFPGNKPDQIEIQLDSKLTNATVLPVGDQSFEFGYRNSLFFAESEIHQGHIGLYPTGGLSAGKMVPSESRLGVSLQIQRVLEPDYTDHPSGAFRKIVLDDSLKSEGDKQRNDLKYVMETIAARVGHLPDNWRSRSTIHNETGHVNWVKEEGYTRPELVPTSASFLSFHREALCSCKAIDSSAIEAAVNETVERIVNLPFGPEVKFPNQSSPRRIQADDFSCVGA